MRKKLNLKLRDDLSDIEIKRMLFELASTLAARNRDHMEMEIPHDGQIGLITLDIKVKETDN